MNIRDAFAVMLSAAMPFADGFADAGVQIGTNTISAAFEDEHLSSCECSFIIEDVTRVFSVFESLSDLFEISDGDFQAQMLKKSPEALPEKFSPYPVLVRTNGIFRLIVPKDLSDSYTNAMSFFNANRAAVTNAYAWIEWLNSGDVTNAPHQEKCELAFSVTMPMLSTNDADNLAGSLFITHPIPPSILEFTTETLPSGGNAIVTWARIPYIDNGENDASVFPMILHNGRWKYYLRQ